MEARELHDGASAADPPLAPRELRRARVLDSLARNEIDVRLATSALGVSARQLRRLRAVYGAEGPQGLVHGNRGRRPANTIAADVATTVVSLATGRCAGMTQERLTRALAEDAGIVLSRTSVHRILKRVGLAGTRARRRLEADQQC